MRAAGTSVLISSAGRRVGLVRAFQEAVGPYGGRVITTDRQPELSAACQVSDVSLPVPEIGGLAFLEETLSIARTHGVGLVIPTLDTELALLAAARDDWATEGIHLSVSDPALITMCRDKRLTAQFFASLGVSPIREVSHELPRLVKPVSGSLSKDIHVIHDHGEMRPRLEDRTRFIHQELIDVTAYSEYTVDALYSRTGKLVCAVPRLRLEVRGGEISKGRTEKGPVLHSFRQLLSSLPQARGCLTIQFFHSLRHPDRPLVGIEVNARFGGGYPMSHAAGATFAAWIYNETTLGQELTYTEDWTDGMTFLRFDDQVAVSG